MGLALTKIGERLAGKTRDDCSTESAVEKLDDRLATNHNEAINRRCKLVVLR